MMLTMTISTSEYEAIQDKLDQLQQYVKGLERKLAEQQALLSQLDIAMPNFAQMFNVLEQDWVRSNSWTTWDEETIVEFRRLHKAVSNPDTEELTKLLEEARKQAVPEGWKLVPTTITKEMAAPWACWADENDAYAQMLSEAPQPDSSIRAKGN